MSNVAQGGAAIAAFFIIKQNKKLKGVASAAGISTLLGITEPAMFGVNLKLIVERDYTKIYDKYVTLGPVLEKGKLEHMV